MSNWGILPLPDPTADQVYEYTLDNAYEGQDSGDTEAPTGWFAWLQWPENDRYYIVSQDSDGNRCLAGYASRDAAKAEFDALYKEYLAWLYNGEEDLEPTCENGCPDGALGRHKMSCRWAGGTWFSDGQEVLVLGADAHGNLVCVKYAGTGAHAHVTRSSMERQL